MHSIFAHRLGWCRKNNKSVISLLCYFAHKWRLYLIQTIMNVILLLLFPSIFNYQSRWQWQYYWRSSSYQKCKHNLLQGTFAIPCSTFSSSPSPGPVFESRKLTFRNISRPPWRWRRQNIRGTVHREYLMKYRRLLQCIFPAFDVRTPLTPSRSLHVSNIVDEIFPFDSSLACLLKVCM